MSLQEETLVKTIVTPSMPLKRNDTFTMPPNHCLVEISPNQVTPRYDILKRHKFTPPSDLVAERGDFVCVKLHDDTLSDKLPTVPSETPDTASHTRTDELSTVPGGTSLQTDTMDTASRTSRQDEPVTSETWTTWKFFQYIIGFLFRCLRRSDVHVARESDPQSETTSTTTGEDQSATVVTSKAITATRVPVPVPVGHGPVCMLRCLALKSVLRNTNRHLENLNVGLQKANKELNDCVNLQLKEREKLENRLQDVTSDVKLLVERKMILEAENLRIADSLRTVTVERNKLLERNIILEVDTSRLDVMRTKLDAIVSRFFP